MKTKFIFIVFASLSALITSCHKEKVEEPPVASSPIFKAEGTLGTESFAIAAGEDNFYMNTFSDVVNGVDFFSGNLTDGSFELEMGIYDGNLDISSSNFSEDLPENIGFATNPTQPLAILSKSLLPNEMMIQQIDWFVNGVYEGSNTVEIMLPGKYNICAKVSFNDGSEETLCNEMILGYTKHATCQLRHFLSQGGAFQAWVDEYSVPLSSVKWFIDGNYASDNFKLITNLDQYSHIITAEINFENGVKRTKSMLIDGSLNGKFIDDFTVFENAGSIVNWDFDVSISLKKNGKQYISSNVSNETAQLTITDVDFYGTNSAGKAVFKISANVICNLKEAGTGEVLPFTCSTTFGLQVE